MALRANALTTVEYCRGQLDIPASPSQDPYLERLINVASQQIERYCNRCFIAKNYVDVIDGNCANEVMLQNFPVISIAEVCVDSSRAFDPASTLPSTDYTAIGNVLRKLSGTWGGVQQSIRVDYRAGFEEIPADIEEACIMLVELRYRMKNDRRLGRESQSKAGEDITYIAGWPLEITTILDEYKIFPMVDGSSAIMR